MVDNPKVVPIWMGVVEDAVAKFKDRSAEEQEVICQGLAEKYNNEEVGAKARELFKAVRPKPLRKHWRLDGGYRPTAGPKPQPKPVEPEPEPPPEEELRKATEPKLVEAVEGNGVLDKDAPLDNARKLVGFRYWHKPATITKLRFWQKEVWEWSGRHWRGVDVDTMRARMYEFLDADEQQIKGHRVRFQPNMTDVTKTIDALRGEANLEPDRGMPGWLLGEPPVDNLKELVAMQNGLLYVPTRKLL